MDEESEVLTQSSFSDQEPAVLDDTYISVIDPACPECDDGGTVLPCDGYCLRSFHFGLDQSDDAESCLGSPKLAYRKGGCNPMAMPEDLARRLNKGEEPFQCPNCQASIHQCYACKEEGSSNLNKLFGAETVARCSFFDCGKFYHPRCMITPNNPTGLRSDHLETVDFVCPQHVCAFKGTPQCKAGNDQGAELIPCRRCPVAYHLQCIPKHIMSTMHKARGKRVWIAKGRDSEGQYLGDPVDRSLIYCMKHKIPSRRENPRLDRPLFTKELLSSWRTSYSKRNLDLPSSVEWLRGQLQHNLKQTMKVSSPEPSIKVDSWPQGDTVHVPIDKGELQPPLKRQKSLPLHPKRHGEGGSLSQGAKKINNADSSNIIIDLETDSPDLSTEPVAKSQKKNEGEEATLADSAEIGVEGVTGRIDSPAHLPKPGSEGERDNKSSTCPKAKPAKIATRAFMSKENQSSDKPGSQPQPGSQPPQCHQKQRQSLRDSTLPDGIGTLSIRGKKTAVSAQYQAKNVDRAARLDYLYQLLEAAGIDSVSGPGYATLTRASYDLIFERLMEKHNFTEDSMLVDLGAGVGKAMWHASVAVQSQEVAHGVEASKQLVAFATQMTEGISRDLSVVAKKDKWQFTIPEVRAANLDRIAGHDYASHIFLFWEGFDPESKHAAGKIFSLSLLATKLVIVQAKKMTNASQVLAQWGFGPTKLSEVIPKGIKVAESGENMVAHFFQKL